MFQRFRSSKVLSVLSSGYTESVILVLEIRDLLSDPSFRPRISVLERGMPSARLR